MSRLNGFYSVRAGAFVIPGPGGLDIGASLGTGIVQVRRKGREFPLVLASCWLALPSSDKLAISQGSFQIPLGGGPRHTDLPG